MVVQNIFVRFRSNVKEFSKEMTRLPVEFKKLQNKSGTLNQRYKKLGATGAKLGRRTRFLLTGFRGFRMEMLSVMFGGMMLQRAFSGLLKPALNLVGAFDILTAALQVGFLPVALDLLENVFLPIFEWFSSMPEGMKKTMGWFAVFGFVLGTIFAVGGSVVLFLGGLTTAWTTFSVAFTASPLGWVILLIAGIVVALIALSVAIYTIWKDWDGVWNAIKTHPAAIAVISTITGPMVFAILSIISLLKFLQKHWQTIWEKIKSVIQPIGNFFKTWVIDPIAKAWEWLIDKIISLWDSIKNIWEKVSGFAGKAIGGVLGGRQTGGYIPHTGLYKLHAGETVNQAGNSFSPNITVNASSNVDIEMLKSQLSSSWNEDLNRMSRR